MTDDTRAALLTRVDKWLGQRRVFVLSCLLAAAALLRIIAYCELTEAPVAETYRHEQMDMNFFDRWAVKIVTDDFKGEDTFHPLHVWHVQIAGWYYQYRKSELGGRDFNTLPLREQMRESRKLWERLYGGVRFHQEPLYPYLIAGVYKLWEAPEVRVVYILQMLGGILTIGLLFGAVRRVFGDLVGVATCVIALLWGPLIHYEMVLLRTSFIILAGTALLWGAARLHENKDASGSDWLWGLFGFGCLVGVATALKTTLLLFALGILFGILWPHRRRLGRALLAGSLVAVGILVVLSPIFLRNYAVGAPVLSLTSVAAATFAGTNLPDYVCCFGWYPYNNPMPQQLGEVMAASQGNFFSAILETLQQHETPFSVNADSEKSFSYPRLLWDKLASVLHWYELPNNTNYYFTCLHSTLLTGTRYIVAASWLIPLGLFGIGMALWRRKPVGTWLWYLLCCLAPMIIFYVLSRFRAPMVVALMPFVAYALVQLFQVALRLRLVPFVVCLVLCSVLGVSIGRDVYLNTQVDYEQVNTQVIYAGQYWTRWLMPLEVLGLVLVLWRHGRVRTWPGCVFACVVLVTIGLLLWRVPTAASVALAAFAAYPLVLLAIWCRFLPILAAVVLLSAAVPWMHRPFEYERPVIPASWFDWSLHKFYMPLAREVREAGDPDAAGRILERLFEVEPAEVRSFGPQRPLQNKMEYDLAKVFAVAFELCGEAFEASMRRREANQYRRLEWQLKQAIRYWEASGK